MHTLKKAIQEWREEFSPYASYLASESLPAEFLEAVQSDKVELWIALFDTLNSTKSKSIVLLQICTVIGEAFLEELCSEIPEEESLEEKKLRYATAMQSTGRGDPASEVFEKEKPLVAQTFEAAFVPPTLPQKPVAKKTTVKKTPLSGIGLLALASRPKAALTTPQTLPAVPKAPLSLSIKDSRKSRKNRLLADILQLLPLMSTVAGFMQGVERISDRYQLPISQILNYRIPHNKGSTRLVLEAIKGNAQVPASLSMKVAKFLVTTMKVDVDVCDGHRQSVYALLYNPYYTEPQKQAILAEVLKRDLRTKEEMQRLIDKVYYETHAQLGVSEEMDAIISRFYQRWCELGPGVFSTLSFNDKQRFFSHLLEFTDHKHLNDSQLEGWYRENALSHLIEKTLKLYAGLKVNHAGFPAEELEEFLASVASILYEWTTAYTIYEQCSYLSKLQEQSSTQGDALVDSFVDKITRVISSLDIGQSCIIPSGWSTHCIVIEFHKDRQSNIQVCVRNYGSGYDYLGFDTIRRKKEHDPSFDRILSIVEPSASQDSISPCWLGTTTVSELFNPSKYRQYLRDVIVVGLKINTITKAQALPQLYGTHAGLRPKLRYFSDELPDFLTFSKVQIMGNCVWASLTSILPRSLTRKQQDSYLTSLAELMLDPSAVKPAPVLLDTDDETEALASKKPRKTLAEKLAAADMSIDDETAQLQSDIDATQAQLDVHMAELKEQEDMDALLRNLHNNCPATFSMGKKIVYLFMHALITSQRMWILEGRYRHKVDLALEIAFEIMLCDPANAETLLFTTINKLVQDPWAKTSLYNYDVEAIVTHGADDERLHLRVTLYAVANLIRARGWSLGETKLLLNTLIKYADVIREDLQNDTSYQKLLLAVKEDNAHRKFRRKDPVLEREKNSWKKRLKSKLHEEPFNFRSSLLALPLNILNENPTRRSLHEALLRHENIASVSFAELAEQLQAIRETFSGNVEMIHALFEITFRHLLDHYELWSHSSVRTPKEMIATFEQLFPISSAAYTAIQECCAPFMSTLELSSPEHAREEEKRPEATPYVAFNTETTLSKALGPLQGALMSLARDFPSVQTHEDMCQSLHWLWRHIPLRGVTFTPFSMNSIFIASYNEITGVIAETNRNLMGTFADFMAIEIYCLVKIYTDLQRGLIRALPLPAEDFIKGIVCTLHALHQLHASCQDMQNNYYFMQKLKVLAEDDFAIACLTDSSFIHVTLNTHANYLVRVISPSAILEGEFSKDEITRITDFRSIERLLRKSTGYTSKVRSILINGQQPGHRLIQLLRTLFIPLHDVGHVMAVWDRLIAKTMLTWTMTKFPEKKGYTFPSSTKENIFLDAMVLLDRQLTELQTKLIAAKQQVENQKAQAMENTYGDLIRFAVSGYHQASAHQEKSTAIFNLRTESYPIAYGFLYSGAKSDDPHLKKVALKLQKGIAGQLVFALLIAAEERDIAKDTLLPALEVLLATVSQSHDEVVTFLSSRKQDLYRPLATRLGLKPDTLTDSLLQVLFNQFEAGDLDDRYVDIILQSFENFARSYFAYVAEPSTTGHYKDKLLRFLNKDQPWHKIPSDLLLEVNQISGDDHLVATTLVYDLLTSANFVNTTPLVSAGGEVASIHLLSPHTSTEVPRCIQEVTTPIDLSRLTRTFGKIDPGSMQTLKVGVVAPPIFKCSVDKIELELSTKNQLELWIFDPWYRCIQSFSVDSKNKQAIGSLAKVPTRLDPQSVDYFLVFVEKGSDGSSIRLWVVMLYLEFAVDPQSLESVLQRLTERMGPKMPSPALPFFPSRSEEKHGLDTPYGQTLF